MEWFEFLAAVLVAAVGSGGIVTAIVTAKMRRAEKDAEEDRCFRRQRQLAERAWISAVSNALFWIARCLLKCEKPNGELEAAIKSMADSEEKIKDLERGKVATIMNE